MRKLFLFVLIIVSIMLQATPVTVGKAEDVADFFLELNCDTLVIDSVVQFETADNITVAYIANLDPAGFIAISTDTNIMPVVAYSLKHDFIYDNDQDNNLYHLLQQDMDNRQQALAAGDLPNMIENNALWTNYLAQNWSYFIPRGISWPPAGTTATGGWLETVWTQNSPYNIFCPEDPETGNRCVVGCVATAISQVLNYHEYIGNRV